MHGSGARAEIAAAAAARARVGYKRKWAANSADVTTSPSRPAGAAGACAEA